MGNAPQASHDDPWRPGCDGRRRREHPPRPRPVTPQRQRMCQHLVALAQPGRVRAGLCDRPGRLGPERHRSRTTDLPAADPDKLVPVADTGGDDVDDDLVSGRRRRLVHLEDLDEAAECFHPSHSLVPRRHGRRSKSDASTAGVTAAPAG